MSVLPTAMSSHPDHGRSELPPAIGDLVTAAVAASVTLTCFVDGCHAQYAKGSDCDDVLVESLKKLIAQLLTEDGVHPRILEVMRNHPYPANNPVVNFLTSRRPPSPEAVTTPEKKSVSSTDKTELLRRNFFETPFVGHEHQLLATALFEYEKKVTAGYTSYHRLMPRGTYDLWYGRVVPVVQSSGMGKSRLMRELSQVKQIVEKGKTISREVVDDVVHPISFTVFTLCLRDDDPDTSMCYPKTDAAVRDYLNEAEGDDPWLHELKVHSLFDAFWRAAKEEKVDAPSRWQAICDPKTPSLDSVRADFFGGVLESCKIIYIERKDCFPLNTPHNLCHSLAAVQASCRNYMETLEDTEWFVLAIDEASGLKPTLTTGKAQQKALASVKRLFASTLAILKEMDGDAEDAEHDADSDEDEDEADKDDNDRKMDEGVLQGPDETMVGNEEEGASAIIGSDPPSRCWLLLADTNAAILDSAPPVTRSASSREAKLRAERCPPYCPVTLNIALEDQWASRHILCDLSPLAASSWSVITRTGRPLWGSELGEQQQEQATASSPNALQRRPSERPTHRPSKDFVIKKLLAPDPMRLPPERVSRWFLTGPQCLALLCQRLHIIRPLGSRFDSQERRALRKAQETQVHMHLGVIIRLPHRGAELTVVTADEPLVAQIATGFMRQNGKGYLSDLDGTVWEKCLKEFRDHAKIGYDADRGAAEELDAQVMMCICHDLAKRRRFPGGDKRNQDPYHPSSAFVHLSDYLAQLTTLDCAAIAKSFPKDAWISAQRFRRVSGKAATTRRDLIIAHQSRYGIIGGANQQGWDVVIPIYCGPLTKPRRHDAWSYMAIQVKNRRGSRTEDFNPPRFDLGQLHFSEEAPDPKGAQTQMEPCCPPLLIWLNMMSCADCKAPSIRSRNARTTAKAGQDCWYMDFPAFNIRNHPALASINNSHFPMMTVDNTPLTEDFVPDAAISQEQALEGTRLFPDPYPALVSPPKKQQRTA